MKEEEEREKESIELMRDSARNIQDVYDKDKFHKNITVQKKMKKILQNPQFYVKQQEQR